MEIIVNADDDDGDRHDAHECDHGIMEIIVNADDDDDDRHDAHECDHGIMEIIVNADDDDDNRHDALGRPCFGGVRAARTASRSGPSAETRGGAPSAEPRAVAGPGLGAFAQFACTIRGGY
jgi:hypothetical protein